MKDRVENCEKCQKQYDQYVLIHKFLNKKQLSDSFSNGSSEEDENKSMYYIEKDNQYLIIWQFFISFLVIIMAFTTPFKVGFKKGNNWYDKIEIFENFSLSMDIVLNFFTNNKPIFNFKENSNEYLKSWFILDIITIFPFELLIQF